MMRDLHKNAPKQWLYPLPNIALVRGSVCHSSSVKNRRLTICYKQNTKSMEPLGEYMLNSQLKISLMVVNTINPTE